MWGCRLWGSGGREKNDVKSATGEKINGKRNESETNLFLLLPRLHNLSKSEEVFEFLEIGGVRLSGLLRLLRAKKREKERGRSGSMREGGTKNSETNLLLPLLLSRSVSNLQSLSKSNKFFVSSLIFVDASMLLRLRSDGSILNESDLLLSLLLLLTESKLDLLLLLLMLSQKLKLL